MNLLLQAPTHNNHSVRKEFHQLYQNQTYHIHQYNIAVTIVARRLF